MESWCLYPNSTTFIKTWLHRRARPRWKVTSRSQFITTKLIAQMKLKSTLSPSCNLPRTPGTQLYSWRMKYTAIPLMKNSWSRASGYNSTRQANTSSRLAQVVTRLFLTTWKLTNTKTPRSLKKRQNSATMSCRETIHLRCSSWNTGAWWGTKCLCRTRMAECLPREASLRKKEERKWPLKKV